MLGKCRDPRRTN